jgi:hypothetical protein
MRTDRLGRRLRVLCFSASLCAALRLGTAPALADGGFLDQVLGVLQNVAVSAAWQKVDLAVQNCLASQYNINTADLISQGVLPSDSRISNEMGNCQQMVAQGDAPQQQEDPAQRKQELAAKYGPRAADKIASGNIDIGFTQDEVADAWGNPDNRQAGTKGREIWVYGDDKVTFTRGKVSAVGH